MSYDFVLIGLTSGGPKALYNIIDKFDQSLNLPIIIVQNLPVGFDKIFAQVFAEKAKMPIEVVDNEKKIENKIYLAKSGHIIDITEDRKIRIQNYEYPNMCITTFIKNSIEKKLKFITICLAGVIIKNDPIEGLKILKENNYPIIVQKTSHNPNIILQYEISLPAKIIDEKLYTIEAKLDEIPAYVNNLIIDK